ncbi:MAG: hypothetical protein RLZZ175_2062 [Bacteroidota bacterium]|jgi:hypothetical protein
MYTSFHISSAQEITVELIEAIKNTFKSKPISITIEEELDTTAFLNSSATNKMILEKSIQQDQNNNHIKLKL